MTSLLNNSRADSSISYWRIPSQLKPEISAVALSDASAACNTQLTDPTGNWLPVFGLVFWSVSSTGRHRRPVPQDSKNPPPGQHKGRLSASARMTTTAPAPSLHSPAAGHKPVPPPAAAAAAGSAKGPWDVRGWQDAGSRMLIPQVSTQRMLIPVEVYVDFICPWCYIEMRSLEAAMDAFVARHPEVEFEIGWRPFYVAPMLKSSCATLDFYASAVPEEDKLRALLDRMRGAGAAHGLRFDFSGRIGATRDAHKLVALAARRGGRRAQALMVELLMRAGLVEGRDISDADVLARVAADGLGLDREDVFLELADDDATRRVDREVEAAREARGIEAVPCVTVLGRFKVGGFQESQVFTDLFTKIYEEKIAQ
ncbi:hypothetical protein V2A60_006731 [Cordyceps javanica]